MTPKLFDAAFFERNQRSLLRLVNSPILGRDMRAALWIAEDAPIVKLTPEAVHGWLGGDQYRATIYSNPQYREALHRSFGWLWKTAHKWDMVVANKLAPALNLGFDIYSSQPDDTLGIDCYIYAFLPTTNNDNTALAIGEHNAAAGAQARTLIKFDFTSFPFSALLSSVVASLWTEADNSDITRTVRWFRQLRAWVETEATWNIWKTDNNWETAGGFGALDCEQTDIGSTSVSSALALDVEVTWSLTLASIKAMIGSVPSFTNNGFFIKADAEANDQWRYDSSASVTAGQRPKMVINYTRPGGKPIRWGGA